VVRNHGSITQSNRAQIRRRGLAGPAIGNNLERDLLSLVEAAHSSTFDGADMDEHILAAVIGLNEAVAFLSVEELHGTLRHIVLLSGFMRNRRPFGGAVGKFEFWENHQSDAKRAARPNRFGRSSMNK